MKRPPTLAVIAAVSLLGTAAAAPLWAHHGWSGYDSAKVLTLTGPIAAIDYRNPHVAIDLKDGPKTWNIVLAPPFRMTSRGLPDGAIAVGNTVTVVGYPNKTELNELRAERITVAGKTIELR